MIVVALTMVGGSLVIAAGGLAMFMASLSHPAPKSTALTRTVTRPVSSRVIGLDRDNDGVYRAGRVR